MKNQPRRDDRFVALFDTTFVEEDADRFEGLFLDTDFFDETLDFDAERDLDARVTLHLVCEILMACLTDRKP